MKWCFTVVLLLLGSTCTADEIRLPVDGDYLLDEPIESEVDRFKGTQLFATGMMVTNLRPFLGELSGRVYGVSDINGEPQVVSIAIEVAADAWVNLKRFSRTENEIAILKDGKKSTLKMDMDTDVRDAGVSETYWFHLTPKEYSTFVEAAVVELQIGVLEVRIPRTGMSAVRAIGGKFKRGTYGTTRYTDDPDSRKWLELCKFRVDLHPPTEEFLANAVKAARKEWGVNNPELQSQILEQLRDRIRQIEESKTTSKRGLEIRRFNETKKEQLKLAREELKDAEENYASNKLPSLNKFEIGQVGEVEVNRFDTNMIKADVIPSATWCMLLPEKEVVLLKCTACATDEFGIDLVVPDQAVCVVGTLRRWGKEWPILEVISLK